MVSLLIFIFICLELFAAVTASKPLLQRTPRRHVPALHKRLPGLLAFARQSGPCCSSGVCCDVGSFCNGDSCCFDGDTACTASEGGGCCLATEYCDVNGCCPNGEICTGPAAGTVTIGGGGASPTDFFTSDTFSSAAFPTTPLGSGAGFGTTAAGFSTPPPLSGPPPPSSTNIPMTSAPASSSGTPSLGGSIPSSSPAAASLPSSGGGAAAGLGGKSGAESRTIIGQGSVLIAVAILSAYLL